ncbi:glycosyltransferase [Acinetobacter sp. YH01009]|uniref:glycosyltransferase n=1 Tax=Acinetobacter sp. YH01009 TaxID=2601025 RepID=UPI0015D38993|nr:glycosyltransferase [Acinetobacter sp. YH01009]
MTISGQPLVTIYIPTYNRVDLLKRAVESVRKQTYNNIEIIIVDDCSTDGTEEFLADVAKQDSRIRYFLKENNSGACVSRNIAIEKANGDFITGLDDDDYFLENRIACFVTEWNEKYKCLFSNLLIKRANNSVRTNYRYSMKDEVVQCDLLKANHIGNQVFTKTIYLRQIQGFDPEMQVWQDLECWYRLLSDQGKAKRIKKDLYVVDISHPHERITNKKGKKVLQTYQYFCKKHSLNEIEMKDLETHMTNYSDIKLSYSTYVRKFINFPSLGNFFSLIKKLKAIIK